MNTVICRHIYVHYVIFFPKSLAVSGKIITFADDYTLLNPKTIIVMKKTFLFILAVLLPVVASAYDAVINNIAYDSSLIDSFPLLRILPVFVPKDQRRCDHRPRHFPALLGRKQKQRGFTVCIGVNESDPLRDQVIFQAGGHDA